MKANKLVSTIHLKVIHTEILDGGPRTMDINVLTTAIFGEISAMIQTAKCKAIITSVTGQEELMDSNSIHM